MTDYIQPNTQPSEPDVPLVASTLSPQVPQSTCLIPNYLLTDILVHLDMCDLLTCRSVCHFWKWSTDNRAILRHKLFTAPPPPLIPTPGGDLVPKKATATYKMHPVFRVIDYHLHAQLGLRNPTTLPLAQRVDFRLNYHIPYTSFVAENFATAPAARKVVVLVCGGEVSVESDTGVKVWDLLVGLDILMKDRHNNPDGAPYPHSRQLEWDCVQFPFAGFRIVSSIPDTVKVKPEFHDLLELTRQASRATSAWIPRVPPITFDLDEDKI